MNNLLQIICRTGIFMICAQAVVHFRPQASYEKYLKLLVSVMVLIQLFLPVSRFLFHGDGEELEKQMQVFLKGLEEELSAAESRAYEADTLLEQMTLEEVRRYAEEMNPGDSGGESAAAENNGTGYDGTESVEAKDSETGNGTIQIDRVQVEEIRVQPGAGSSE